MPLYDYKCKYCGKVWEEFHSMSSVPSETTAIGGCLASNSGNHFGRRHFTANNVARFTEDRLRFWKGPMGNGFSTALGAPMPDNRADLQRLEKEKGIEFLSPSSMPREWEEAVAYRKHVDEGGERLEDPSTFYDVPSFSDGDTRPEYMKK